MSANDRLERKALVFSIIGNLVMAGLGIGFSLLARSGAILLDGLFSLAGFLAALVTLRVATLARQPDDKHFHFGYGTFEPMFNVAKGVIIIFVGVFALVGAVDSLLHGGRSIEPGYAVIYAVFVAACCFIVMGVQRAAAKKTHSPLVEVDARNWFVDGVLTLAILVAFLIAWFMQGTAWEWAIDYVDPVIVAVLVILVMPVPYFIIRDNLHEVLLGAPSLDLQRQVETLLRPELEAVKDADYQVRMVKVGRFLYINIFLLLSRGHPAGDIVEQDAIRERIAAALARELPQASADVSFTLDPKWVGAFAE